MEKDDDSSRNAKEAKHHSRRGQRTRRSRGKPMRSYRSPSFTRVQVMPTTVTFFLRRGDAIPFLERGENKAIFPRSWKIIFRLLVMSRLRERLYAAYLHMVLTTHEKEVKEGRKRPVLASNFTKQIYFAQNSPHFAPRDDLASGFLAKPCKPDFA